MDWGVGVRLPEANILTTPENKYKVMPFKFKLSNHYYKLSYNNRKKERKRDKESHELHEIKKCEQVCGLVICAVILGDSKPCPLVVAACKLSSLQITDSYPHGYLKHQSHWNAMWYTLR